MGARCNLCQIYNILGYIAGPQLSAPPQKAVNLTGYPSSTSFHRLANLSTSLQASTTTATIYNGTTTNSLLNTTNTWINNATTTVAALCPTSGPLPQCPITTGATITTATSTTTSTLATDSLAFSTTNSQWLENEHNQEHTWETLVIATVIHLTALLPCILGNLFIFFLVAKYKKLRTKSNLFIINLSVADFLVGILVIPLEVAMHIRELQSVTGDQGSPLCLAHRFLMGFLLGSSLMAMLMMSIDRYLALSRPFFYIEKMTPKVIKTIIGVSWVFVLLVCCPLVIPGSTASKFTQCNFPKWNEEGSHHDLRQGYSYGLFVMLIAVFGLNIVLHIKVAKIALKQYGRILDETKLMPNIGRGDMKNTRTMVIMFGIFIIMWLPYVIVIMLYAASVCSDTTNHRRECRMSKDITLTLGVLNSSFNCYIYAMKKRDFRSVMSNPKKRNRLTPIAQPRPIRQNNRNLSTESVLTTISAKLSHQTTELSFITSRENTVDKFDTSLPRITPSSQIIRSKSADTVRALPKSAYGTTMTPVELPAMQNHWDSNNGIPHRPSTTGSDEIRSVRLHTTFNAFSTNIRKAASKDSVVNQTSDNEMDHTKEEVDYDDYDFIFEEENEPITIVTSQNIYPAEHTDDTDDCYPEKESDKEFADTNLRW